jgi:hypothetical protein
VSKGNFWNVYIITHTGSGMRYVGITQKPALARWATHIVLAYSPKPRTLIALAIRDHGVENFTVEHVLCCRSRLDAEHCEALLISTLNCQHPEGFNATPSGGTRGITVTDQMRAASSLKMKRWWQGLSVSDRQAWVDKKRETMRKLHADPVFKEAHVAGIRAAARAGRTGPKLTRGGVVRDRRQGALL